MPDGVKGTIQQIPSEVNETVIKPVAEEVGKAIEQGIQSVVGTQLTPQQINNPPAAEQQKELEKQQRLSEARRKIEFWRRIDQEQKWVRQQKKQEELQKQQQVQQQKQIKKFEIQQKKQPLPEEVRARSLAERKAGRGVGG